MRLGPPPMMMTLGLSVRRISSSPASLPLDEKRGFRSSNSNKASLLRTRRHRYQPACKLAIHVVPVSSRPRPRRESFPRWRPAERRCNPVPWRSRRIDGSKARSLRRQAPPQNRRVASSGPGTTGRSWSAHEPARRSNPSSSRNERNRAVPGWGRRACGGAFHPE